MKRLLTQGLKFLAITLGLYLLAFFALARLRFQGKPVIYRTSDYYQWKGGVAFRKFTEFDAKARWDAVVLGSSHAYRGYDPRVFATRGYRMFNLGSSAQTPMNGYHILEHYLDRANTRLVILDLYENTFDQRGLESTSELTQNITNDAAAAGMALSLMDPRSLNLMALRFFTRGQTSMYDDTTYVVSGYATYTGPVVKNVRYDKGRPFVLEPMQDRYLHRIIALCRERHLPLVLATHFYPRQSDRKRHARFQAYADSTLAGSGLRWFDLAYGHGLSDTLHFHDHNHMNEAGARIFNERLIDSLEAHGYLGHGH